MLVTVKCLLIIILCMVCYIVILSLNRKRGGIIINLFDCTTINIAVITVIIMRHMYVCVLPCMSANSYFPMASYSYLTTPTII